jgi:transposase InsO family protein
MGRNATDDACGCLRQHRYVLHDRDSKFCTEFRETLAAGGVKCVRLPPRSPNLNAFAERWVRSVKEECLSKRVLFGEACLKRALPNSRSITMRNAIIKAKKTDCYFLRQLEGRGESGERFDVRSDWAVC